MTSSKAWLLGSVVCSVFTFLVALVAYSVCVALQTLKWLPAEAALRPVAAVSAGFVGLMLMAWIWWRGLKHQQALAQARRQMAALSSMDEVTGTFNRRHFMDLVGREWLRAQRYETWGALLVLDVDRFEAINQSFGFACGDALLRALAGIIQGSLREVDVLACLGGQEMVVFLPHTDPLGALDVAERIRERVEQQAFDWHGQTLHLSVSIGSVAMRAEHLSLDELIHDTRQATHAAKQAGRNCVRALPGWLPDKHAFN